MPTYQYACTECEHAFDQVQSFTDDTLTSCPECTGRLRKVFNAVGVVFKGSGFYRNDSRGQGHLGRVVEHQDRVDQVRDQVRDQDRDQDREEVRDQEQRLGHEDSRGERRLAPRSPDSLWRTRPRVPDPA